MSNHLAERIKSARLMRGYSLQELASQLEGKLTAQAIGRYERSESVPNSYYLNLLSRALSVSMDYFERESFNLGKVAFRKRSRLPIKEENRIKELARDFLERYIEAEHLLEVDKSYVNPLANTIISTFEQAEETAELLRETWQLGSNPIHSIVEELEDNGIKVFSLEADDKFDGLSPLPENEEKFIVVNKNMAVDRLRFTLLHELGHLLLSIDSADEERIVNRFAGAMLFPKSAAERELGKHRKNIHFQELLLIKEQYGISAQAILYRAKDLQIISDYTYQQMMKMIVQLGWRKVEPAVFAGKEEPRRFFQLLCRGISEEIISSSKAAQLYGMKLAAFRKELIRVEPSH